MQIKIENAIIKSLSPKSLEVINESHKHNVPKDSESHFKIIVVSDKFTNLKKIARHRMVFEILKSEMQYIHALACALYSPEEWEKLPIQKFSTPDCARKR